MQKIIIKFIKFYQRAISPFWAGNLLGLFNSSCRFYPTCSEYAIDAVCKYGACRGMLKTVGRVLRCNPLFKPGMDQA